MLHLLACVVVHARTPCVPLIVPACVQSHGHTRTRTRTFRLVLKRPNSGRSLGACRQSAVVEWSMNLHACMGGVAAAGAGLAADLLHRGTAPAHLVHPPTSTPITHGVGGWVHGLGMDWGWHGLGMVDAHTRDSKHHCTPTHLILLLGGHSCAQVGKLG